MITTLIDTNPILIIGLTSIFEKHFENMRVLSAESVDSFHQKYEDMHPELVVFTEQHDADNANDILKLKANCKTSAIIIYDAIFNAKKIREYFKLGVMGCISRRAGELDFVKCVEEVLDGKRYIGHDFQELFLNELLYMPKVPKVKSKAPLSPRENEIASYLSNGRKPSWIAKELERKPSTISTIKSNIFRKLKVNNVLELRQLIQQV